MEPQAVARPLRNLALIYLALAHGTDQELDDAEVALMADRLRVYLDGGLAQGTVVQAISEALRLHQETEHAAQHLEAAIKAVGAAYPGHILRRILDDLTQMASVDGKVLHAEAQFLGRITRAWALSGEPADELWSLLGPITDMAWSPMHDLLFIYLTLAYDSDMKLGNREVDAILEKVHEWIPDASLTRIKHMFSRTLGEYAQYSENPQRFKQAVESVKRAIPVHQRSVLLDDLRRIAYADGAYLPEEQEMIHELARAWGIQEDTGDA